MVNGGRRVFFLFIASFLLLAQRRKGAKTDAKSH
jgi:hypothetical protein